MRIEQNGEHKSQANTGIGNNTVSNTLSGYDSQNGALFRRFC